MDKLLIVCGTRGNMDSFMSTSRLGLSLARIAEPRMQAMIFSENKLGLPVIYNRALRNAPEDAVLLFVHDDVYIDDYHLFTRLDDAFRQFDVVGLAGNATPDARQVGWSFYHNEKEELQWYDDSGLTGAVGHGDGKDFNLNVYGPSPRACRLLDALFIAARVSDFRRLNITFDERFSFHFWDLDISNTCAEKGLKVGTWPIAVTHASLGAYNSDQWKTELARYREKWDTRLAELYGPRPH